VTLDTGGDLISGDREREVTLNIGGDLNILGQGERSDTKHWW
jgi:hypothetical protein